MADQRQGFPLTNLAALIQRGRKITYGIVQPGEFVEDGVILVRGRDYSFGWRPVTEFMRVTVEIDAPYKRSRLKPGDILMTIVGANTGNVAVVPFWLDGANITQTTARIAVDHRKAVPEFVEQVLRSHIGQNEVHHYQKGGAQPGLNLADVEKFRIPLPPLPEQRRIAAILGTWDAAIEKAERLASLAGEALRERRTLLLSARHSRNRREWRTVTFGDVTEELTSRNGTRLTSASVMGVIKGDGFQPMRERTIGSDLSRYKIVPPSAFAYNPMRLNIGSLAFSTFATDVLVSPDYVVFEAKRKTCAPEFLNELRQSPRWAAWCQQGGSGSVRTRIYYSDLIGMPIDLPPLPTQRRISAVLADLANRHKTAVRRLELLRGQKRGLMQKLLTGEIRVPEAAADLSPAAD